MPCLSWETQNGNAILNAFKTDENTKVEDDSVVILNYEYGSAILQGSYTWPFGRTDIQVYGPKGGIWLTDGILVFERRYSPEHSFNKTKDTLHIPEASP